MRSTQLRVLVTGFCLFLAACDSESPGMPDATPSDARSSDAQVYCGDGVREADEMCDGEDLGGHTCVTLGYAGGALACEPWRCQLDETGCSDSPTCGDGVLDPLEECDDGNGEPWDGCTACRITEFRINSDMYAHCGESAVAVGPSGELFVAWEGCFCGEDPCWCYLFGRRLDAQARFLGQDFEIPLDYGPEQYFPAVASLPSGGYATVWWTWYHDPAESGMFGQAHQSSGAELGSMFQVTDGQAGWLRWPAVAPTASGFLVAWAQDPDNNPRDLRAQHYHADGTADGTPISLLDDPAQWGGRPALARAANNRFVAVWEVCGDLDGDGCGIFGRIFLENGTPDSAFFQVNTFSTGDQRYAEVATAADGRFVVVWQSRDQDGDHSGIFGQRFGPNATPDGGELQINSLSEGNQEYPAVAMQGDGRFMVVWEDWNDQYSTGSVVMGRLFPADGSPAGAPFQVNQNPAAYFGLPSIAVTSTGGFVVVFHGPQNSWEGGLFGQRYDADGNALGVGP